MVAPPSFDLVIKVNDVDVTDFVPFSSISAELYAMQVSRMSMTIENPTGVTPTRRQSIVVTTRSLTPNYVVFVGFLTEVTTRKRGIYVDYQIDCGDRKLLLQNSVLDVANLTGTDSTILGNMLGNAFPDLSDTFDFSSDVNGFSPNLDLPTGNNNLLDSLNDLEDLSGGGSPTFETNTVTVGGNIVTFSSTDGYNQSIDLNNLTSPFVDGQDTDNVVSTSTLSIIPSYPTIGGNLNDCIQWSGNGTVNSGDTVVFICTVKTLSAGETDSLANLKFDYYINSPIHTYSEFDIRYGAVGINPSSVSSTITENAWTSADVKDDGDFTTGGGSFPFSQDGDSSADSQVQIRIVFTSPANGNYTFDIRLDNIEPVYDNDYTGTGSLDAGKDDLQWNQDPLANDFDFDVDFGDEFGADFEFTDGDFDDFNSITVIGGNEEVAVVWTYESDGDLDHFNLEAPITATGSDVPTVEVNTGSDASPTWTSQTVGLWGTDTLTGDGGDKDVLYDNQYQWLYFDSNPSALSKSIRVTGNILRPIRVRINADDGTEQIYATTYQNENITSEAQAVAIATQKLNERRENKTLRFKTYEPNIRAGKTIRYVDTATGLDETLLVRRVSFSFISGKTALFQVEAGTDEAYGASRFIANNDKRSRNNILSAGTAVTEINLVTDALGRIVTDALGRGVSEA